MLIDHRTYRILPGHWNEALELMIQIRQHTRDQLQHDFEIMSSRSGPFQTIGLEFAFDTEEEHHPFMRGQFYPALQERGWLDGWFSHVMYADAHNLLTIDRQGEEEKAAKAPRPSMLVFRQYFEPVRVGETMNNVLEVRDAIRAQFQRNFRITRPHISGVMGAVFWEFCYTTDEQQVFDDFWYTLVTKNDIMTEYASYVRMGYSELWYSHP